jgi:hypothetical protein
MPEQRQAGEVPMIKLWMTTAAVCLLLLISQTGAAQAIVIVAMSDASEEAELNFTLVTNHLASKGDASLPSEDACRSASIGVRIEDAMGNVLSEPPVFTLSPQAKAFEHLSIPTSAYPVPNVVRVVKVSEIDKQGNCIVRVNGRIVDALTGATVSPMTRTIELKLLAISDYHGTLEPSPYGEVSPRHGSILVDGAAGETMAIAMLLIDSFDSPLSPPPETSSAEPCQSASFRLVIDEPTEDGTIESRVVKEVDLSPGVPFAEHVETLSHSGTSEFRFVFTNGGFQGACRLAVGGRHADATTGRTIWAGQGTSMSGPF